jgi:serine phosphatase RsbU (regulator of sigma subunit)
VLFYSIWDVLNILLIAMPLFFLGSEWLRSRNRNVLNWLVAIAVLCVNYIILFFFRTEFYSYTEFLSKIAPSHHSTVKAEFFDYFRFSFHLALNNAALMSVLYAVSWEIRSAVPRFNLIVKINALWLAVALIGQFFLNGTLLSYLDTFQLIWFFAALIIGCYLVTRFRPRNKRGIYYAILGLVGLSSIAYGDIPFLQVLFLLASTVAFGTIIYYLGRLHNSILVNLEDRRDSLINERDVIISVMQDIGREIKSISEVDQTLALILKKAMHVLQAQAGAIYLLDADQRKLSAVVVEGYFPPLFKMAEYATTKKEHIARLMRKHKIEVGDGIIGMVAQNRQDVLIKNGRQDPRVTQFGKDAVNLNTLLAAPLQIKDNLLGVIVVVNKENAESFNENEAALFNSLATQTSITINNAKLYASLAEQERIRREVEFAKNIQQNLLPKQIPQVNGIQLSGDMIPALEVGGDYYDFIKRSDERLNMVIGDVAGKGIPAGMIMLMIRTILHAISSQYTSTKDVICAASRLMMPNLSPGEFMTLIYLAWDSTTRTIHYTSAGHEHIVIYRTAQGKCENIMSGGIAIGMHDEIGQFVEEKSLGMEAGDIVVLYTDGITEAFNTGGEMYGLDRLMHAIETNKQYKADDLKNIILQDIKKFVGNTQQHDDITIIVAKII